MGETGVPAPVRGFISSHIVSVAQLDVLLLLRAAPDKAWTPDTVARALVIQPDAARNWLEDLAARGLAAKGEHGFTYAPAREGLGQVIDDLADSYAKYRVAVIGLIFARPSERITTFADAFRIRRRKR